MQLEKATLRIFRQLEEALSHISSEDYSRPLEIFHGATIGQHVRHSLEMFVCLNAGYESGEVNYENRKRDKNLEEIKTEALQALFLLEGELDKPDKQLKLLYGTAEDEEFEACATGYYRELVYCIEHAVHHMAIIKIGLKVISPELRLPEEFGVAASTLKHRKTCVQ